MRAPNTYVLNANRRGPSLSTPPKPNRSHVTPTSSMTEINGHVTSA